ncbi:molybdopterin molybdotransferase MoeA [Rubrivirga sp. S365]|uniref:Molybdopterin molybdenumtransferase n=1 Tax=Rubrivirga litoralis TaxID=3075598 RepID=A0ABU3BQI8_9BACT|nr:MULTISPECIES: molybdopterin molybdotransferase MoeA [unclassified Rubrivirga]MDT0631560.1 molybdopterin molybdotransferase MoeA [Rubrivirga sp. F394]MDT7857195.1 molybdopterin molybdotransferase MoeA [Rubrivirga sp. S365]
MITVAEADALLSEHVRALPAIAVPLAEAAGRVLREAVVADRDVPPFDRVTMDGVALASADLDRRRFRVASTQAAGEPPHTLSEAGDCVEIMTGAALAEGADTVVRYEDLVLEDGWASLREGVAVTPGQNIHGRGDDRRAGEPVLGPGVRIGPGHVTALASLGAATVRVSAVPRVAVVTTGDEVVAVAETPLPHQIRQSNGPALRAALALHGVPDVALAHAPDDEARLRTVFEGALRTSDMLVLTGGVSAGRFDLVPGVLASLGVREVFHKVRQKPGKPLWFGVAEDGTPVFGLPGNPVSALVGLVRYVVPFLDAAAGRPAPPRPRLRLTALPRRKNDFTHFVPVRRDGLDAHPAPSNGSGDVLSLVASDGIAEVAAGVQEPGSVPFIPWSPL